MHKLPQSNPDPLAMEGTQTDLSRTAPPLSSPDSITDYRSETRKTPHHGFRLLPGRPPPLPRFAETSPTDISVHPSTSNGGDGSDLTVAVEEAEAATLDGSVGDSYDATLGEELGNEGTWPRRG